MNQLEDGVRGPLGGARDDAGFWTSGRIVTAQTQALREVDEFRALLSEPSQNNFVLRMVPKTRDEDAQFTAQSLTTGTLNQADFNLMHFCSRLLPDLDLGADVARHLASLVDEWRQHYDNDRNLLGCEKAIEMAAALAPYADLASLVAERAPKLIEDFCSVPAELYEVVRLNLYLPWGLVLPVARTLVSALDSQGLLHAVERIEIAQRHEVDNARATPSFPTVILYLGLTSVDRPGVAEMSAIHDLVAAMARSISIEKPSRQAADLGLVTAPGLAVTQGFRLHKRYLRFLGVLDRLFDAASGHALIHPSRAPVDSFAHRARAVFLGTRTDPDRAVDGLGLNTSPVYSTTQRNSHG